MIFVLDNFDSFTYNLVHLLYEFESDIKVFRNRSITVEEVITLAPEAIILSPGPGRP
ncbi:MAG: aminodeoxychorismate/anthranilate synthase component II, partial [Lentisphaeria bacterium]|nr:aminodeoxychorismate/anthranilate synthase component II [Lentisphaeria bacterium]